MLSDEEKKAIKELKADTSFYDYELKNGNYIYELFKIEVYKKDVDVILNLIEKQSKEIEELKEQCKEVICVPEGTCFMIKSKDTDKKWEDKTKAKIEELDEEIKVKREIAKNPMDRVSGRLLTDSIVELEKTKKVLQSLLEKE